MSAITILTITVFIFSFFSLTIIFFSSKNMLNEITKEKKIVFIFLKIVFLCLINNIKLVDGINNYKNKFFTKKIKLENNNLKEDISPLATEFEDNDTLFHSAKKDTFLIKNISATKNEERNEFN